MLFYTLWAYQTFVKSVTVFTPFQLVYGVEFVLHIHCEISSLELVMALLLET